MCGWLPLPESGYDSRMTIPPFPAPTPGDPNLPGVGLTPEEREDVLKNEEESGSAWAPSDPSEPVPHDTEEDEDLR
jgi:hypothetical protein